MNSNLLRSKIVLRFGTSEKFAAALNRPSHYVSRLLTGNQKFSRDDMKKWADALELTNEEIIQIFFED